jgi:hypothetical protein
MNEVDVQEQCLKNIELISIEGDRKELQECIRKYIEGVELVEADYSGVESRIIEQHMKDKDDLLVETDDFFGIPITRMGTRKKPNARHAIMAAALGMTLDMYMSSGRHRYMTPFECSNLSFHTAGEPNSRREDVREHHKEVRRKKRTRKSKKGY